MSTTMTPGRGGPPGDVNPAGGSQQPRPGTTRSDAGIARRPIVGRTLWQINPDHIGLLHALEAARTAALVEHDRRVQAETDADDLRRALTRAAAGLDRLAILNPTARPYIDHLIEAIWPSGRTP